MKKSLLNIAVSVAIASAILSASALSSQVYASEYTPDDNDSSNSKTTETYMLPGMGAGAATGVVIAGYSLNQANTTAHAEAVGIDGGEEDDALLNADAGSIVIVADARVFSKTLTISVLGDASGEANTIAESAATGMRGGAGDDDVLNRRGVTVSATAHGDSAGASIGLFGRAHASAASAVSVRT